MITIINEIVGILVCCVFPAALVLLLITSHLFPSIRTRDKKTLSKMQLSLEKEKILVIPFFKKTRYLLALTIINGCAGASFFYATFFDIILCFIFAVVFLFAYFSSKESGYVHSNMGLFLRGSFVYRLWLLLSLLIYISATFAPFVIKHPMIDLNNTYIAKTIRHISTGCANRTTTH